MTLLGGVWVQQVEERERGDLGPWCCVGAWEECVEEPPSTPGLSFPQLLSPWSTLELDGALFGEAMGSLTSTQSSCLGTVRPILGSLSSQ